jgi:protein ImuB
MRVLCIHFPNWPIQRLLASDRGLEPAKPLILDVRDPRRGQLVAACNTVAYQHGVRPGMPLVEAAALAGRGKDLHVLPSDQIADVKSLGQLAEHCERFSPLVGWETTGWETTADTPVSPDRLLLDVTGTAPLFGGETALIQEVVGDLTYFGYEAQVAIANTIGAAWAHAVYPEPLPVSALRLATETIDLFEQLGVTQIEQLFKLPRASLRSRFGMQVVQRLDQFLGAAGEVIVAYRPRPRFIVERVLEYPAESRELIEKIVFELVQRITAALAERRQGAVKLACRLDAKPPLVLRVGLYRPSANPLHLWDLLRVPLEQPMPGPISRVTLAASLTAPLENRQQELFEGNHHEGVRQFELLVDRLSSRLGSQAVLRPEFTADPLPERAVELVPWLEAQKQRRRTPPADRPLILRSPPLALAAVSIVPSGPPVSFRFAGQGHRVARWWGPERIESGWWRGAHARRDYYRVETDAGNRYWLFRKLQDGQWFLHGEFA